MELKNKHDPKSTAYWPAARARESTPKPIQAQLLDRVIRSPIQDRSSVVGLTAVLNWGTTRFVGIFVGISNMPKIEI